MLTMISHLPSHFILKSDESTSRIGSPPQQVIDLFYFRSSDEQPPALMIVIGTLLDGELLVVSESRLGTLPDVIGDQVRSILVSRRGQIRTIVANHLVIFSLEAIEQRAKTAGFNDAVTLYGRIQAILSDDVAAKQPQIQVTALDGRLHVGRLDLLHAFRSSLQDAFHHPHNTDDTVYHCFAPVGLPSRVDSGFDVGLIYPLMRGEMTTRFDNHSFTLRIVYDLLVRFQEELIAEMPDSSFAKQNLAVPNRQRLEKELLLDHYRIDGDVAIKEDEADSTADHAISWLGRLRRAAKRWSAHRILLPPQASMPLYADWIQTLWATVVSDEDRGVADMMTVRVKRNLVLFNKAVGNAPPATVPANPPAPPQPTVPAKPPVNSGAPLRSLEEDRDSWRNDFADSTMPKAAGRQSLPNKRWWQDDFDKVSNKDGHFLTSADDEGDFDEGALDERVEKIEPQDDWSQDFER